MSKEIRWSVAIGILGAGAVGLLITNAQSLVGALGVLTFLGVMVVVIIELFRD